MQVGALKFEHKHWQFAIDSLGLSILLVWFAAVCVYFFDYESHNTTVYRVSNGVFEHLDFINIYMTGKMVLSEDRHHVYDPKVQLDWYNRVISPAHIDTAPYCQYFPYFFLLNGWLGFMSLRQAFIVWDIVCSLLAVAGLILAWRLRSGNLGQWPLAVILTGMLASFPSVYAFMGGEMAWITLAWFAFFYWSFVKRYHIVCGAILGVMSIKPHYAAFALIPVLVLFEKRILVSMVAVIALLLAASGLVAGWENVFGYPQMVLSTEFQQITGTVFPERFVCLRGPASIFLPKIAPMVGGASFALGLALTFYVWYLSLRKNAMSTDWAMSLTVLLLLITSLHVHAYDCLLLALPAVLTLRTACVSAVLSTKPVAFKLWCATLFAYPILSWLIMSAAPKLASQVLPQEIAGFLVVNKTPCGLISFTLLLFVNILLLALGFKASRDFSGDLNTSSYIGTRAL